MQRGCGRRLGQGLRPLLALIAGVLLSLSLLRPAAATGQGPLRLQLMWLPQAQFAGAYVAQERGLFAAEGLRVELLPGGPGIFPLNQLVEGKADVAMGWLSDALQLRSKGADIVNVAQLLQRPATMLVCRQKAGIRNARDLKGKRIGSWFLGDQFDVGHWLRQEGLQLNAVTLQLQQPNARDLIAARVDCATAMQYNEFVTLLESGSVRSELYTVHFADHGAAFLEDGLYVHARDLRNAAKRRQLAALLRALAQGWRYAERHPEEAVAITESFMTSHDRQDTEHQRQMLQEILKLMDLRRGFGLLNPSSFARSVTIVGEGSGNPAGISAAARGAWSHKIWRLARIDGGQKGPLGPAGRHTFAHLVQSPWFYGLDLVGTAAFGISGFLRALQRRYDLWGCFILTLLPAVGGGTLRDLLIGGDRSPPFIFKDGTYLAVVVGVIVLGCLSTGLLRTAAPEQRRFNRLLTLCDSVGLATFTIIGARVALESDLAWWWMPICAALTCAGGGLLLDVVSGREPRTFQGEPYEELAVLGALVLIGGLLIADRFETLQWPVLAALIISWCVVFVGRELVVKYNWRSWSLGSQASADPAGSAANSSRQP